VLPLAALRDTALETIGSNVKRFVIAFIILAFGIVAITAAANDAPLGVLGLGVLLVFTAVLIMGPGISRPVALTLGQPIRKIRGVTGGMARQNAARNPKRTARTAAPVLIGVALVTAFASFASSFKSEIRDTIGSQFKGDFAISVSNNGFGGLPITLVDEIGALPEVAQATGLGFATITLDGKGRFVQVINPKTTAGLIDLEMVSGSQSALSANGILVSDTRAIAKDWSIGTPLDIVLVDGTTKTVTIEGTFVASGFTGSYVINRDLFADTTNTLFDNSIYVTLAPGVSADVARAKIEALSSEKGLGKVESRAEFIDAQSSQIDQFFGIIYGLLFLSIIIAIVGIVITLLLSVFERRREIGLLRAVGMTRGQAWESITWESVITSFIGAVTGIVLGIVMGAVLITVLSTNGISTFRLPVGTTIFILIMAFIVGVIAAVYPAWRATRTDIISAIATN
jgi:putative ABC transport system permease protein